MAEAGLGQRAERVWASVTASGLPWPRSRVTVTVAPDRLPKHDSAVDLAMAVAVLAADGTVPARAAAGVMYYAGLDGRGGLVPVPGVLAAAAAAAKAGCRALVVAAENTAEARLVQGVPVTGARRLADVIERLRGDPVSQAGGHHLARTGPPGQVTPSLRGSDQRSIPRRISALSLNWNPAADRTQA